MTTLSFFRLPVLVLAGLMATLSITTGKPALGAQ